MTDTTYCDHCGVKLEPGAKFCQGCGERVAEFEPAAQRPAASPPPPPSVTPPHDRPPPGHRTPTPGLGDLLRAFRSSRWATASLLVVLVVGAGAIAFAAIHDPDKGAIEKAAREAAELALTGELTETPTEGLDGVLPTLGIALEAQIAKATTGAVEIVERESEEATAEVDVTGAFVLRDGTGRSAPLLAGRAGRSEVRQRVRVALAKLAGGWEPVSVKAIGRSRIETARGADVHDGDVDEARALATRAVEAFFSYGAGSSPADYDGRQRDLYARAWDETGEKGRDELDGEELDAGEEDDVYDSSGDDDVTDDEEDDVYGWDDDVTDDEEDVYDSGGLDGDETADIPGSLSALSDVVEAVVSSAGCYSQPDLASEVRGVSLDAESPAQSNRLFQRVSVSGSVSITLPDVDCDLDNATDGPVDASIRFRTDLVRSRLAGDSKWLVGHLSFEDSEGMSVEAFNASSLYVGDGLEEVAGSSPDEAEGL